ncbi:DUF7511 domain-containing protein [Haloarchaeobius sp. TZWWS8]|uniref:DUF7511 domain-containing protein n=1 Tax=Haloarchaeobius sp. TZWWS8 TaxID=3446121 RepID=UPI003EC04241
MTNDTLHDTNAAGERQPGPAETEKQELETVVEPTPRGAEVTVYPSDVDEDELVTTWLTADENAVVDLEEWC